MRPAGWVAAAGAAVLSTALLGEAGGRGARAAATASGDLTIVQAVLRLDSSQRGAARIRRRVTRAHGTPARLRRLVPLPLIVVSGAGERPASAGQPTTFVATLVLVRRPGDVGAGAARKGSAPSDLEDHLARATFRLLTGLDVRRPRAGLTYARATNLVRTRPSDAFCTGADPSPDAADLPLGLLNVGVTPPFPWRIRDVLRDALAVAARACGRPAANFPPADEVDRFLRELVAPSGVTTTTLPEECDGEGSLGTRVLVDPPYPGCVDVEWPTPIPPCADDVAPTVVDVASGEPIGPVLFGHTAQVTFFKGPAPITLAVRACNQSPGDPGGATITLAASAVWGG